jgi:hypothetical protein
MGLYIGLAQDASQYLFYVNTACTVGKGGQNICKGTIPAFFECVYGKNITDGTIFTAQIYIFKVVNIGGLDGDFFREEAEGDELLFYFWAPLKTLVL